MHVNIICVREEEFYVSECIRGAGALANEKLSFRNAVKRLWGKTIHLSVIGMEGINDFVVVATEVTPVLLRHREEFLHRDARRNVPIGAEDHFLHPVPENFCQVGLLVGPPVDDAHR